MSTKKNRNSALQTYGPVPSRRLGFSLGIDIVPLKTCSLNCIYCQLGPTSKKTIHRKEYFSSSDILAQIKKKVSSGQRIDYITFSGSGEPTLNSALGKLIREIKKTTSIPVAVLTNSTLLSRKSVRNALMNADLVVPSLDAATQEIFVKINRPYPSLKIEEIMQGLLKFSKEFKGSIWLEIMLVKGVNDSPSHIRKLKEAIAKIKPEKVQLNTVIRPPAEKNARPLSLKDLEKIKSILGENCEIIVGSYREAQISTTENLEGAILSMIRRRPVTLAEISTSLGKGKDEIIRSLDSLLAEGKIKSVTHKSLKYFEPK
ncbi:MAG: radical SAM protein [Candidatus Aminicenantes bacterium]|nr:radical SAM protein [Candidatus Aminicenantes bacterium]